MLAFDVRAWREQHSMALRLAGAGLIIITIISLTLPSITLAAVEGPNVVAERWIIIDVATGETVAAHDADAPQPMASLTKMMTAVIALERGNLDMPVTITQGDLVGEASAGLRAGTTVTLRTLLYGLILKSGNDAAMAIARAVGGSATQESDGARGQFVSWMNERAAKLGLTETRFANPHGLDAPGHQSSARDLARLTLYALTVPGFREIFTSLAYEGDGYSFQHGNKLPGMMPGVVGGKTGWTDGCGLCLIEVAERNGRTLIVVLLGSDWSWYQDALKLFDYGFSVASSPTYEVNTITMQCAGPTCRTLTAGLHQPTPLIASCQPSYWTWNYWSSDAPIQVDGRNTASVR